MFATIASLAQQLDRAPALDNPVTWICGLSAGAVFLGVLFALVSVIRAFR